VSWTKVRLREAWNWGGLSAWELARRTWAQMNKHGTLDRAAVIAFYAMLALVPFAGIVLSIALGWSGTISQEILDLARQSLPPETYTLLKEQVFKVQAETHTAVLSIGFLVLLWSASSLFVAVMDATNAAYGVDDSRPWWKRRLWAIVLTVIESALLLAAASSIMLWPRIMGWLGLSALGTLVATVVQWLVVLAVLFATFAIAYYFGPDVEQEWEWITPGSALGVLTLVLATLGFRLYVEYGTSYSETYGTLAGVIVTLFWLYLASLALLLGAEVNGVIEHAARLSHDSGRKEAPQPWAAT
jgi:membrane protein